MTNIFFGVLLALSVYAAISAPYYFKKDTTDGSKRSGLVVYTDQATKVQYVASPFGMTVRLDRDGKPYYAEEDDFRK